jgi:DNA polymerase-3 subunit delta'
MTVWKHIVGQSQVVEALEYAAREPRAMSQAWLFTGPPGSGRSTAARAFAAALECEFGTGCGVCQGCTLVMAGIHPDVKIVATEFVTIKIEEVRDLVALAATTSSVGRHRVIIIEDADRMAERTVNVLLKAIEEPPAGMVWLLCAPTPADVLPTIRSRCRLVRLQIPRARDVASLLISEGVERDLALRAAHASQSHVGRARMLAADPAGFARRLLLFELVSGNRSVPGAFLKAAQIAELASVEAGIQSDQRNAREHAALLAAHGLSETDKIPPKLRLQFKDLEEDQKRRARRGQRDVLFGYFLDILSLFRDAIIRRTGSQVPLINEDAGLGTRIVESLASSLSPEQILLRIDAVKAAQSQIGQNVPVLLALESLMVSLIW